MKLRGHHLFCIFGWQGFGYSETFNAEMDKTVSLLEDPTTKIIVSTVFDDLCRKCPNLKENSCFKDNKNNEKKIKAHDKRVLNFLSIGDGQKITAKELKRLIDKKKSFEKIDKICAGCSWLDKGYCYKGLKTVDRRQ